MLHVYNYHYPLQHHCEKSHTFPWYCFFSYARLGNKRKGPQWPGLLLASESDWTPGLSQTCPVIRHWSSEISRPLNSVVDSTATDRCFSEGPGMKTSAAHFSLLVFSFVPPALTLESGLVYWVWSSLYLHSEACGAQRIWRPLVESINECCADSNWLIPCLLTLTLTVLCG